MILNIETSTEICSVALSKNGKLVTEKIDNNGQNHAKLLTVLIRELLHESNTNITDLSAVAISRGPGSYTGLRIGTSVAKGICYGASIPLISINTLQIMASDTSITTPLSCPMIDARRMEVYCQLFDANIIEKSEVEAKILDNESFSELLEKHPITFLGNGSHKFAEICHHPNAVFAGKELITPLASQMISLSTNALQQEKFDDTAYFTPFYLKKFQVTQSKKKML